jgi:Cu2+-exporting ATPase
VLPSETLDGPDAASGSAVEKPCAHCGLPTSVQDGVGEQDVFCCSGCRQAYQLIRGWGLDDYYALRDRIGGGAVAAVGGQQVSSYESFDDEAFLGASAPRQLEDGCWSTELSVSGLHCAACAWLIENVAARTPGWKLGRIKLNRHTLQVVFDPRTVKLSEIARLVARLGYGLMPLSDRAEDQFHLENRRLLTQIAIAGFCTANAMWIAVALYAGDASGVAAEHRLLLRLFGTALGVAAVAIPGRTFFTSAIASLRTRTPHMDLPVALGLSVGTLVGIYAAVTGTGEVYFDSLTMLVFLLLIGRWIQFRQQHRAASAVDLLLRITPQHARLIEGDRDRDWVSGEVETRLVMARSLDVGQWVRVNVGESIPVDGTIVQGQTMVDRSLLTGESVPVEAAVGTEVTAGTINLARPIAVQVQATGAESRIGKVMQSVEAATEQRTPIVQLADSIGGVFVVVVTVLALIAFAVWLPSGLSLATSHATSLLIVACPCALALATPLAIAVTLGRAAKRKILVRDGGVLQRLGKPGVVWFDKTGTLTEGRPRAELVWGDRQAIAVAAAIERDCCHPIAHALIGEAERLDLNVSDDVGDVRLETGGVQGRCDHHNVAVGNERYLRRLGVRVSSEAEVAIEQTVGRECSPILIAIDGSVTAVVSIADPIKQDAAATIAGLHRLGWNVGILSGDHQSVVDRVARSLGIERDNARGQLSPEDKLSMVTGRDGETTVMVGDGANDAAALAAADVGIAVRGGAEVSLQAAPVFVASGSLSSIGELVDASRRSNRLIGTTFALSLTYNVVAVVLALLGWISPLLAAILMPISSVSVLSTTLAWPTFKTALK